MMGVDVSPLNTGLITIVALVGVWLVVRRVPRIGALTAPHQGKVGRAVELGFLAVLAALSVGIIGLNAATGLDAWDGWAMWVPKKAHALFVEGDVWGPVFTAPAYQMQHEEYPVLFPGLEALSSAAIGRFDPRLVDIESAAVLAAFGWGAWAVLRLVMIPAAAAAVALWLTGSAPLIDNGAANYATPCSRRSPRSEFCACSFG